MSAVDMEEDTFERSADDLLRDAQNAARATKVAYLEYLRLSGQARVYRSQGSFARCDRKWDEASHALFDALNHRVQQVSVALLRVHPLELMQPQFGPVVWSSQQACLEVEYSKSKADLTIAERNLRKLAISHCKRDVVRMRDYEGMLAWFKSRIAHLSFKILGTNAAAQACEDQIRDEDLRGLAQAYRPDETYMLTYGSGWSTGAGAGSSAHHARLPIRHNWSQYYERAVADLESTMKRHQFHGDSLTKQIQRIVVHWQKKRTQYLRWEAAAAPLDEEAVECLTGRRVFDPTTRARSRGFSEVSACPDPRDMSSSPAPVSLTTAQRKQQIGTELVGFSAALPPTQFRSNVVARPHSPLKSGVTDVASLNVAYTSRSPLPLFRARSASACPSLASTSSSSTGIPSLMRSSRSPSVPAELAGTAVATRFEGSHNPILMDDQDDYEAVRYSLNALTLYTPLVQARTSATPGPVPGSPSMRIAGSAKSPRHPEDQPHDPGYSSGSSPLRSLV